MRDFSMHNDRGAVRNLRGFDAQRLRFGVLWDGGICNIEETEEKYIVRMKSISRSCVCSACGAESTHAHGTYRRRVQDLPILGKGVELQIRAKEYWCDIPLCSVTT